MAAVTIADIFELFEQGMPDRAIARCLRIPQDRIRRLRDNIPMHPEGHHFSRVCSVLSPQDLARIRSQTGSTKRWPLLYGVVMALMGPDGINFRVRTIREQPGGSRF